MGFPGLVISDTGEEIQGYVFVSDNFEKHWEDLDKFEGEEYQRVITQVTLSSGGQVDAYVYALR